MTTILEQLRQILDWIVSLFQSFWERFSGQVVSLDSGRQVRVGRKIAEGGFSYVYRATDTSTHTVFALKRIRCEDQETLKLTRKEADVHHAVGQHKNTLSLLGTAYDDKVCWMLFPFMPHSLRDEVNKRIFHNSTHDAIPPWSELAALQLFRAVLDGVDALHRANYSHRDIKLENILFSGSNNLKHPVIMDFGSVGPLTESISSRRELMQLVETASSHTTMPYRPPELFEGEVRVGESDIDFRKVDVWSLGCTLFAMLYGASPFESEFNRSTGAIRIVDCTQLKVIGDVRFPYKDTPPAKWYSQSIQELITWMLTKDRNERPSLVQVIARVDSILDQDGEDPLDVLL